MNEPIETSSAHEYVVVARRYRPQTFDDLIGQNTVSQALRNAIETDRVGHAYLFTGARGVGKTSTARILAKSLNCITGPTPTPCGECEICRQIAAGGDVDVLEIDGASNRGIDEIRQLRSNVGIRPSRGQFKVYIIDEVHMLTKEAFNALLKTLEEPPEHVKFVFCTTEPAKIPVTVLSRCQRFDFPPVKTGEIVGRLQHIVEHEGAEAEPAALELIARRAAGSMRDSQSLLEQLLSFVSEPITVDHVHAMLGTARDERLQEIIAALMMRDAALVIQRMSESLEEGVDVGQLAEQLVVCVRDMMVALVGGGGELLLCHSPSQLEDLKQRAADWGIENLLAVVQILDEAVARMRQSVHARILLEIALIRVAHLEDLTALHDLIQQLDAEPSISQVSTTKKKSQPDNSQTRTDKPPSTQPTTVLQPAPEQRRVAKQVSTTERRTDPDEKIEPIPEVETAQPVPESAQAQPSLVHLDAATVWREALELLNDLTADYAGMADRVAISAPNRLVVAFRQVYNSSKSFCERSERKQALEQAVSSVAGQPVQLEFEVVREDTPHQKPSAPQVSRQQQRQMATRHPFVEQAIQLFEADVMKVDVTTEKKHSSNERR